MINFENIVCNKESVTATVYDSSNPSEKFRLKSNRYSGSFDLLPSGYSNLIVKAACELLSELIKTGNLPESKSIAYDK